MRKIQASLLACGLVASALFVPALHAEDAPAASAAESIVRAAQAKAEAEPTMWELVQERRIAVRDAMQRRQARRAHLMSSLPEARAINEEISSLQKQLHTKQEALEQLFRADAEYAGVVAEQDRLLHDMTELQKKHAANLRAAANDTADEQTDSEDSP